MKLILGEWLVAIGTNLVLYGELRELAGETQINNKVIAIGEVLGSFGSFLMASGTQGAPHNFKGNIIDGIGEAIAVIGSYTQYIDPDANAEGPSYATLCDSLQMLGSGLSARSKMNQSQPVQNLANTLQSFGAGLEVLGTYISLNDEEEIGLWIGVSGAVVQSFGTNISAFVETRKYFKK